MEETQSFEEVFGFTATKDPKPVILEMEQLVVRAEISDLVGAIRRTETKLFELQAKAKEQTDIKALRATLTEAKEVQATLDELEKHLALRNALARKENLLPPAEATRGERPCDGMPDGSGYEG